MSDTNAQRVTELKTIVIDLADVCADMSVLADTSAARTTARVLCMAE